MEIIHPNTNQVILQLVFAAGVLLQIMLILKREFFRWDTFWIALSSLLVFAFVDEDQISYQISHYTFFYIIAFCFIVAGIKREHVFVRISERSILQMLLICIYTWYINVNNSLVLMYLSAVIAFGALLSLGLSATIAIPTSKLKLGMYLWHVFASLGLLMGQVGIFDWDIFAGPQYVPSLATFNLINALVAGLVTFPLVVNIFSLAGYIPYISKHTSWAERVRQIREHAHVMIQKVSPEQTRAVETILIIIVQGGFLVVNAVFSIIPPFAAIGLSLILVEVIVFTRFDFWAFASLVFTSLLYGHRGGGIRRA